MDMPIAGSNSPPAVWSTPPSDYEDPVIEAYKRDVDRTLLRENLRRSVAERFEQFDRAMQLFRELQVAGQNYRAGLKDAAHEP
jgi:hypothetical protein